MVYCFPFNGSGSGNLEMDGRGNTKANILVTFSSSTYAFDNSMLSIKREPEIRWAASLATSGGTALSMERMAL